MIYVDNMEHCIPNSNWRYNMSCHLFADNLDELHEFAKRIGLKKGWFQNSSSLPRYDLTGNKRLQAIRSGAKAVDRNFVVDTIRELRKANKEQ